MNAEQIAIMACVALGVMGLALVPLIYIVVVERRNRRKDQQERDARPPPSSEGGL